MTQSAPLPAKKPIATPDLNGLVRFLAQPFLEETDSLSVDSEVVSSTKRIIVRVAVEGEDKGRVFGRGGRNIQSIRTVVHAIAQASGYSAYLEFFGGDPHESDEFHHNGDREHRHSSHRPRGGGGRRPPRRPPRR